MQELFKRGHHDQLEDRIRALIVDDLVAWSTDTYGHFVVQACFRPRASPSPVPPLQRGLEAFLRLPAERLRELVMDCNAYHVLGSLLQTSVDVSIRLSFLSRQQWARAGRPLGRSLAETGVSSVRNVPCSTERRRRRRCSLQSGSWGCRGRDGC